MGGKAEAQFFFASCLLQGKGVPKNTGEAVNWCEKAAHQGYDKAIQCLDDIKYSHVCEKIARNMVCTQADVAVLERMSMRGTIGAESLLVNARFGEPLRLPPAGIQHRPVDSLHLSKKIKTAQGGLYFFGGGDP